MEKQVNVEVSISNKKLRRRIKEVVWGKIEQMQVCLLRKLNSIGGREVVLSSNARYKSSCPHAHLLLTSPFS